MKSLFLLLSLVVSGSAFANTCESGDTLTVGRPFQYVSSNGTIKSMEVGTVLTLDNLLFQEGVRAIADFSVVEGQGVRAQYNQAGKITGCSVDWRRVSSIHMCAGPVGGCAATFAPRKMTFFECDINP